MTIPLPGQRRAGSITIGRLRRYIGRNALQIAGQIFLVVLIVAAIYNLATGIARPHTLLQNFFFGLSTGSIYALIALGYTLVYGILFMINFAHGEVFMAGGYMGYFAIIFAQGRGWLEQHTIFALFFTITIAAIFSIAIALLLERVAYRPLRGGAAPRATHHGHRRQHRPAAALPAPLRRRFPALSQRALLHQSPRLPGM